MRKYILLLLIFILPGCWLPRPNPLHLYYSVYFDPEMDKRLDFNKICIWVESEDISTKKLMEEEIALRLPLYGVNAIESARILIPTRNYTALETEKLLDSHAVDALIVIYPTGSRSHTNYIPGSSYDITRIEKKNGKTDTTTTTITDNGYLIRQMDIKFQSYLLERASGRKQYVATTHAYFYYGLIAWPLYFGQRYVEFLEQEFGLVNLYED